MVLSVSGLRALVICQDPKQAALYSDLTREVDQFQIDVLSQIENGFQWVGQFGYHLVVIDHPQSLTYLEQIKRLSPVTTVILIAESESVEQAVSAIRTGAEDYLKKPISIEAFQLAIKRGLDKKAIFQENEGVSSYLSLIHSCQMISGSFEQRRIFEIIRGYLTQELGSQHSVVYSLADDGGLVREDPLQPADQAMQEVLDIALHASNVLHSIQASPDRHRFLDKGQLIPGLFVFRFQSGEGRDHFCVCLAPKAPKDLGAFESRLNILRAQIEVTGKNIQEYQGVQKMVYLDDATGLYNTRYLHSVLDREILQAQANQTSFAVLFIDVDKFKAVNDQNGHLVGTQVLNELGHQLKSYVRDTDTVFRYGGDEFVAVLSPCDLATGEAVAERIRHSVEQSRFLKDQGLNLEITVSIGVSLFPEHADCKAAVINTADKAMYSAKKESRNRVFITRK